MSLRILVGEGDERGPETKLDELIRSRRPHGANKGVHWTRRSALFWLAGISGACN
jgi:hypothetical protein